MDHCLVAFLDCGCAVKDFDAGVEISDTLLMVRVLIWVAPGQRVYQARALPYVVPLDFFLFSDGFNIKTNRSICLSLFDADPVLVNAFDGDFLEVAVSIRAEHHVLVQLDSTSRYDATEYQTDTLGLVAGVHHELIGDGLVRVTNLIFLEL